MTISTHPNGARLPFVLDQVHSIKWLSGDPTCTVTYFIKTEAASVRKVRKLTLDEMETLQPSFKRFYACASLLTQTKKTKFVEIALRFRQWNHHLKDRPASDFILKHWQPWAWDGLAKLDLGVHERKIDNPYVLDPRPLCAMRWENASASNFRYETLEANCPGFIDWFVIMCEENDVDSVMAFELRRKFVKEIPYDVLASERVAFSCQLRASMSMGLSPQESVEMLRANAVGCEREVFLPDLDTIAVLGEGALV